MMPETNIVPAQGIKNEARRLVEQLSDEATWEDLMYEVYVRQTIEAGLEDSRAGRVLPVNEVRAKFGLSK
jgi:predicted transcriptional regulator